MSQLTELRFAKGFTQEYTGKAKNGAQSRRQIARFSVLEKLSHVIEDEVYCKNRLPCVCGCLRKLMKGGRGLCPSC